MKRTIGIIILCIALLVSLFYNYSFMNKLETANSDIKSIKSSLEDVEEANESTKASLKESKSALRDTIEQLEKRDESLSMIDEKLMADGNITQKIDELLAENSQWRDELDAMTIKLNALEEQISVNDAVAEEEPVLEEEAPALDITTFDLKQWVNDIDEILTFIDSRKSDLDAAASTLPTFSLEGIMINQEIDFLDDAMNKIILLQDDIVSMSQP